MNQQIEQEEEPIIIEKQSHNDEEELNEVNALWEETLGQDVQETEVTVAQEEAVPDYELVFEEDSIYETELEQSLLRALPIYQQNRPIVQRRVAEDVRTWLELNRLARAMTTMGPRKDKLFQTIRSNQWNVPWLLPVVLDRSNLYFTKEDEENWRPGTMADKVEQFEPKPSQPILDPRASTLVSMEELFLNRNRIEEQYKNREIKYDVYKRRLWELSVVSDSIINPDADPQEPVWGNKVQMEHDGDAIRYWNILDTAWSGSRFQAPLITKVDIKDSQGKWLKTIEKTLESGTSSQVVAIARLPTKNVYADFNDSQLKFLWNATAGESGEGAPAQSSIRIRARITQITTGDSVIITAPNHGLQNGMKIRLFQTNSIPNIDGVYQEKVQVLDADRFTIGVSLGQDAVEGTQGIIISHAAIPWVQFEWNEETQDWDYMGDKRDNITSPKQTWNQPTLLWAGKGMTQQSKWDTFLEKAIPSIEDILTVEQDKLAKIFAIDDWKVVLNKYQFQWSDVPYTFWKQWYEKMFSNMNPNTIIPNEANAEEVLEAPAQTGGENLIKPNTNAQVKNSILSLQKTISQYETAIEQIEKYQKVLEEDRLAQEKHAMEEAKQNNNQPQTCTKIPFHEFKDTRELESDQSPHEDGELARIGAGSDTKVFEWQMNQWVFDEIRTNFYKMCELPSQALEGKSWGNALECAYEASCLPKQEEIVNKAHERMTRELDEFRKVLEQLVNPPVVNIPDRMFPNVPEMMKGGANEEMNTEEKPKTVIEENYDERVLEIRKNTKDPELRAEKVSVIMKNEGLKIGCRIISLDTLKVLGCIHEFQLYQILHTLNQTYIDDAGRQFIGEFGVPDGSATVCKYCGAYLQEVDSDLFEGFSKKTGNRKESSSIWEKTDEQVIREARDVASTVPQNPMTMTTAVLDVPAIEKELPATIDPDFRTNWVKYGGNLTELEDAREMGETIHFVMNTLNLNDKLDAKGFWDSIQNILHWSRNLPSYTSYAARLRAQLQRQGISIANLREEVIKERYMRDVSGRKKMALLSQLHLWITTTFPVPIPQPIGAFQSTYQGWDGVDAVLFWLHMGIEFGWDAESMRRDASKQLVPYRLGTPEFQQSISRLQPRFESALKEFEEYPNMIQRKKVYQLAAKRAQFETKDNGLIDENVVVLERIAEGPDDLVPEWSEMWLEPADYQEVEELREVATELQSKLIAELQLAWLYAPDKLIDEDFDIATVTSKQFAWYEWDKRSKIMKLNKWLDLRPMPTDPQYYPDTAYGKRIKVGSGKYEIVKTDQTKQPAFLEALNKVIIVEDGNKREMTPSQVNMETGETMNEIEAQKVSYGRFEKYEAKLAKETAIHLKQGMQKDLIRQEIDAKREVKSSWSFQSREDWMKLGLTQWVEMAQRAWDDFVIRMTEWKQPDDKLSYQRRLISLYGKYLTSGEKDYEVSQSMIRMAETPNIPEAPEKKKQRRVGVPAELRPDMLPPISRQGRTIMMEQSDESDMEEEKEEEFILWKPNIHEQDGLTIEEISSRIQELYQLIYQGFKRSQRTAVSQVNLFQQINRDKEISPDQRQFLKDLTEREWSWIFPYTDDEQKRELIAEFNLNAPAHQVDSWLTRIQPQEWVCTHMVNKQNIVNVEKSLQELSQQMSVDARLNGWLGILFGIWTELLNQLNQWLQKDYQMIGDFGRGRGNQVATDWIEAVMIYYEGQLRFSHSPSEEERMNRLRQRQSSYMPEGPTYKTKLSQIMRSAGRTTVAADEEEEGEEPVETQREKREEALREEHPDWTTEQLEAAIRNTENDIEEDGMITAVPYNEALMSGLDYGEQGDLDDNDDRAGELEEE